MSGGCLVSAIPSDVGASAHKVNDAWALVTMNGQMKPQRTMDNPVG